MFQRIAFREKGFLVIADASIDSSVDDAVQLHAEWMEGQFGVRSMGQDQFRQRFIGLLHRFNGELKWTQFKDVRFFDWKPAQDARQLMRNRQNGTFQPHG